MVFVTIDSDDKGLQASTERTQNCHSKYSTHLVRAQNMPAQAVGDC